MFVDSHCHLTFPDFQEDFAQYLARMAELEVHAAMTIATRRAEFEAVRQLAQAHEALYCSIGVHPDAEPLDSPHASEDSEEEVSVEELVRWADHPKVLAIGETGLDYYRLGDRTVLDMQWQRDRFVRHIQASAQTGKPLVVHTRSASEDTLALLSAHMDRKVGGVLHCFTESREVAEAALDLGMHISLSGIVSFKSAKDLQEVAKWLPLDRLLIETDSPYLAPVPYRGKRNQPAWVRHVGECLAQLRGISLEDLAQATTRNFETLFKVKTSSLGV